MGFNLNKLPRGNGGGDRVQQPTLDVGSYPARLVRMIDMGVQPQRAFKGQDKPPAHEVDFTYELLDVFMLDKEGNELEDKPRWISESFPVYRLEADLAKSTKRYKALDPNMDFDGDMSKLVGQPCMVTIVHGDNKKDPARPYENIGNVAVMRAKEAAKAPDLKNDPVVFLLDEPDMEVFNKFPQWIQDKLKGNLGYAGSPLQAALEGSEGKGGTSPKGRPKKASEAPVEPNDDPEGDDNNW